MSKTMSGGTWAETAYEKKPRPPSKYQYNNRCARRNVITKFQHAAYPDYSAPPVQRGPKATPLLQDILTKVLNSRLTTRIKITSVPQMIYNPGCKLINTIVPKPQIISE